MSLEALRPFLPLITPSILSADPLRIASSVESLEPEDRRFLHVDVMDGHFVPNLSYGPAVVKAMRAAWPESVVDAHLMVEPPEAFLDAFLAARPHILTVHVEATPHIHRVLQTIREAGVSPGLVLNPGTPVESLYPVLHMVDLVLVMSVNPGFGGQKFIPEVLDKVRALVRQRTVQGYQYLIQIDGGVGVDNAASLAAAGCDLLVAGNAVFGAANPDLAARMLREAAQGGKRNA